MVKFKLAVFIAVSCVGLVLPVLLCIYLNANDIWLIPVAIIFIISLVSLIFSINFYNAVVANPNMAQILRLPKSWIEAEIRKLNSKANKLDINVEYDLLALNKQGFVIVGGNGQSITRIFVNIENRVAKAYKVKINPGTYFVSKGNYQNMATTTAYSFTLEASNTEKLEIDAVCINANSPIPRDNDTFQGVEKLPEKVTRFLQASKNEDPMVIQAGVWTLTDYYSAEQIINHLTTKDRYGNIYNPITTNHIQRGKHILNDLGIKNNL